MARGLRHSEYWLDMQGLALLRLRYAPDASTAYRVVEAMKAVLGSGADNLKERTYPVLDPMTGYGRWASAYDLPGNPVVAHGLPPTLRALFTDSRIRGEPAAKLVRHAKIIT